ncbi:hypothetical protein [Phocaeicola sp.]
MEKRNEAFLEKAAKLINEHNRLESLPRNGQWDTSYGEEYKALSKDMLHLLYSYDPNIPEFVPIRLCIEHGGTPVPVDVVNCLKYVVHYVEDLIV